MSEEKKPRPLLTYVMGIVLQFNVANAANVMKVTAIRDDQGMWSFTESDPGLPSRYLQLLALIDDAIKETDKGGRVYLSYGINRENVR